jgi:hypothetical protein
MTFIKTDNNFLMPVDIEKINIFLHYGYFPNAKVTFPESLQDWLDSESQPDFNEASEADLIIKGANALRRSFKLAIAGDHNKTHIVPLSGGLDSRTILANLLEQIDPARIITVTFGMPGSPDFESARSIARRADVKWEGIDLSPGKWKWSSEMLIETSKRSQHPTRLFDSCVNHAIQLRFGKESIYWSGFMGDSLGCIEPISNSVITWEEAKKAFVRRNCISKRVKITNDDYIPENCLPLNALINAEKLDYYSQLNHFVRQQCLTKHIYSPLGYDIRYPFLSHEWVNFILNVPEKYGCRQALYRKIQRSYWPHLFNKWNSPFRDSSKWEALKHRKKSRHFTRLVRGSFMWLGLRTKPDRNVKYIDWNYSLQYHNDFKDVVFSNLQDLKTRKIIDWLNLEEFWHLNRNVHKGIAFELMMLAALELHIKAKKILLSD